MKHMIYAAAGLAALALAPIGAKAEDASWGCQVLLCAASQNPSWHGVPYCVPPMKRLISAMKKPGFDWPICHEAKAGEPGREIFDECPEGSRPTSSNNAGDRGWDRHQLNQCSKTVNKCENRNEFYRLYGNEDENQRNGITVEETTSRGRDSSWSRDRSCMVEIRSPRPRRADPWFFDIPNDKGVKERFWFNLDT